MPSKAKPASGFGEIEMTTGKPLVAVTSDDGRRLTMDKSVGNRSSALMSILLAFRPTALSNSTLISTSIALVSAMVASISLSSNDNCCGSTTCAKLSGVNSTNAATKPFIARGRVEYFIIFTSLDCLKIHQYFHSFKKRSGNALDFSCNSSRTCDPLIQHNVLW